MPRLFNNTDQQVFIPGVEVTLGAQESVELTEDEISAGLGEGKLGNGLEISTNTDGKATYASKAEANNQVPAEPTQGNAEVLPTQEDEK